MQVQRPWGRERMTERSQQTWRVVSEGGTVRTDLIARVIRSY